MATLTETLSNGLKSLFSGLGTKTTDSNYAVPLVNKNDATPTGYMEMMNLAAVIEKRVVAITSNSDLNTYTDVGAHYSAGNASLVSTLTSKPNGLAAAFFMVVLGMNGSASKMQVIFANENPHSIYIRYYSQGSSSWAGWTKITGTSI